MFRDFVKEGARVFTRFLEIKSRDRHFDSVLELKRTKLEAEIASGERAEKRMVKAQRQKEQAERELREAERARQEAEQRAVKERLQREALEQLMQEL